MGKQVDELSDRIQYDVESTSIVEDLDSKTLFTGIDIQNIQDEFSAVTGVASIITRPDGTPITQPSNFTRLCSEIIRCTETGLRNCYESDALLGKHNPDGPTIHRCHSGGLWDAGASITMEGTHVATWLIGQVRNEAQSEESMRDYARIIGVPEEEFLAAFREVPVMSQEQFEKIARFLFTMARELSASIVHNRQQDQYIEELKQSDLRLSKSNVLFTTLSENIPGHIASVNAQTLEYEFVNHAFEKSFGLPRGKIIGSHIRDVIGEDNYDFALNYIDIVRSGQPVTYENTFNLTTGTRWIEVNYTPVFDDHGAVTSIVVLSHDITDRKQAEERLQDSEYFFKESQRVAHIGSYKANFITGFWESSEVLDQIFGIDADFKRSIPGWIEIIHPDDREQMGRYLQEEVIAGGKPFDCEYRIIRRNDQQVRWVDGRGEIVKDDGGRVITLIGTIQDITERKLAEEERVKLQAQLNQAQKMESIGQLAGGVAHNYNNMLAVILGHADFALNRIDPGDPLYADIDAIRMAAQSSADLTSQLLAFARKQIIAPRLLDLNEAVEKSLKLLQPLIGETITVHWLPTPESLTVSMDPTQLDQLIMNLCLNARDAIQGNGEITIETSPGPGQGTGNESGGSAVLTISDNGCGMEPEIIKKIFDPFFTTKTFGKGTGLGLSSIYGTIKQNGGSIDVASEPGRGTRFTITLPISSGPEVHMPSSIPAPSVSGGKETILIVEDNNRLLTMCERILSNHGYRILTAETPTRALEITRQHSGRIHLLLSDILMPEMKGQELACLMLALNPDLKCLFMSGYSSDFIHHRGSTDVLAHFIQKPFRANALALKIRAVLDDHPV